jgi:hypothetical protein
MLTIQDTVQLRQSPVLPVPLQQDDLAGEQAAATSLFPGTSEERQ